jgi:hypothetical protein
MQKKVWPRLRNPLVTDAFGWRLEVRLARRIEQLSEDEALLNQGTIYAALVRLQNRGWIAADQRPKVR